MARRLVGQPGGQLWTLNFGPLCPVWYGLVHPGDTGSLDHPSPTRRSGDIGDKPRPCHRSKNAKTLGNIELSPMSPMSPVKYPAGGGTPATLWIEPLACIKTANLFVIKFY